MTKKKKGLKLPKGYVDGTGNIKIAISFSAKLFKEIKAMAVHDNKRFSEMVSKLCEVGLMDLEESDRLEPEEVRKQIADRIDGLDRDDLGESPDY